MIADVFYIFRLKISRLGYIEVEATFDAVMRSLMSHLKRCLNLFQ